MKIEDLVFVGIGGKVVALYRDSGQQAWLTKLRGDFVTVTVQDGRVYAASSGEMFCLDPFTGRQLWKNPLKGCGMGLVTIAFSGSGNSSGSAAVVAAQKARQDEASAAAAASAS